MSAWHPVAIVVVTFVIAVLATILALNFTAGEKEIKQHLEHHYGVADSQFLRSMGVLLGPALVGGNQVTTLLNGDQIFPSMLQAIRGAKKHDHVRDLHLLVRIHREGVRRCAFGARAQWRAVSM